MSEELIANSLEPEAMAAVPPCPNGQLYTVKSGDTMFMIAKNSGITLQSLINANPQIVDPNLIYPGQVICVPVSGPAFCPQGKVYRVVKGDTMFEIARRFGVTLEALILANPQIKDPNRIYPGEEICIPTGVAPMPCPNGVLYTVKSGDTMYEIARRNNISLASLIAANPQIVDPNKIYPGQVICVPKAVTGPVVLPITELPMPMPLPTPMPMPPMMPCPPMPCPPGQEYPPTMYPMPLYVVVQWDQCPYRPKKKKRDHDRGHCGR